MNYKRKRYNLTVHIDDGEIGDGGVAVLVCKYSRRTALLAAVSLSLGTYWVDEPPRRVRLSWKGSGARWDWWFKDGHLYRTEPKLWGSASS